MKKIALLLIFLLILQLISLNSVFSATDDLVLLNKPVTSSTHTTGHYPSNITDGNLSTYFTFAANATNGWIIVDLQGEYQISELGINFLSTTPLEWRSNFSVSGSVQLDEAQTLHTGQLKNQVLLLSASSTAVPLEFSTAITETAKVRFLKISWEGHYTNVGYFGINEIYIGGTSGENLLEAPTAKPDIIEIIDSVPTTISDLSTGKPVFTTRFDTSTGGHQPNFINDNNDATYARSRGNGSDLFWIIDLERAQRITKIEAKFRADQTVNERKDFKIVLSNNINFDSAVEVVSVDSEGAEDSLVQSITDTNKYRYVKIQRTTAGTASVILSVRELTVYGIKEVDETITEDGDRPNPISLLKPATAHSVDEGQYPYFAVDGDISTYFRPYYDAKSSWLIIDLGGDFLIDQVILYFTTQTAESWRKNFTIQGAKTLAVTAENGALINPITLKEVGNNAVHYKCDFSINEAEKVRFIKIDFPQRGETEPSASEIGISEVKIYGTDGENLLPIPSPNPDYTAIVDSQLRVVSDVSTGKHTTSYQWDCSWGGFPSNYINDGLRSTAAAFVGYGKNCWTQIDLGKPYRIVKIECYFRDGVSENERNNIELRLSNDINFTASVTVKTIGATGSATVITDVVNTTPYRYVRINKSLASGQQYIFINEMTVFAVDNDVPPIVPSGPVVWKESGVGSKNVSAGKEAIASGYDSTPDYTTSPDKAFDGLYGTADGWGVSGTHSWLQVDLGKAEIITSVEYQRRESFDPDAFADFEIRGSNDETFATYDVLASQGAKDPNFTENIWKRNVTSDNRYRYIRFQRTAPGNQYTFVLELRIFAKVPELEISDFRGYFRSIDGTGQAIVGELYPNENVSVNLTVKNNSTTQKSIILLFAAQKLNCKVVAINFKKLTILPNSENNVIANLKMPQSVDDINLNTYIIRSLDDIAAIIS